MHNNCNTDLADHTTHRTTPVPDTHQSTPRGMCHFYSAGLPPHCLVELQFRDQLSIDTCIVQQPIMPSLNSSAHLGHWRLHSHPLCVDAQLQFCSANLHMFLHNIASSPHRRRILMVGDCMVKLPHKLGIVGAECDV